MAREDSQWSEEARASVSYIYVDNKADGWEEDCSCNCTTTCLYNYTEDDEDIVKNCSCTAKFCGISSQEGGIPAKASSAQIRDQITLSEIGT